MSEQNFDYSDIMRIGEDAARTLNSQVFLLAYQMAVEEITAGIFNTEPGHVKTLEEFRRQGNALALVVSKLRGYVTMAESETAKRQQRSRADQEDFGFAERQ